jgi:hypothetical protein
MSVQNLEKLIFMRNKRETDFFIFKKLALIRLADKSLEHYEGIK